MGRPIITSYLAELSELACNKMIATDFSATVNLLKEEYKGSSAAINEEAKRRFQNFSSVQVVHEKRTNVEAHNLERAAMTITFGRHL